MKYENNDRLREYLDRGSSGTYREYRNHPRFEFDGEAFAAALDQVRAQFPEFNLEDAHARAAFRLLTSGVAPEVAMPLPSPRVRATTFLREKSARSWPWLKLFWAVSVLILCATAVALLSTLVARAEPSPQQMQVIRRAMRGVNLFALPAAAAPQQPGGVILQFQQAGSPLATRPAGLVAFNCGTGMNCSFSGTTFTLTSTGAGGSGCVPPGTPSRLLYDNGAGGCLDTGLTWSGSTATAPNGVTLTYSGSGIINARKINNTEFINGESLGKIPIGQGDGTAVWADPLVQGLTAHDAVGTSTNPVLTGGYASATAPTDVSNDGDAVRAWFLRNGSQVFNLASGGTLVTLGQKAMSGSLPVTFASDQSALNVNTHAVTQSGTWNINNVSGTVSLPTGAATSANQSTEITSLQLIDNLPLTQGSTTSGQSGVLTQGAVTTSAPTYTNGQTSPLSLTTAGELRVSGSFNAGITQINDENGMPANVGYDTGDYNMPTQNVTDRATGSAVPAWATMVGGTDGTNLRALSVTTGGALNINNVAGTVSLPTGAATAANQSTEITSLQLIDNLPLTQGSTTSGQSGLLAMCAVTTGSPSYTNAQTSPCSVDTSGRLRVAGTFNAGIVQVSDNTGASQNVGYETGDLNLPTQNISDGADDAAFTPATNWVTVIGAVATSDTVDSGDRGALAMDISRNLKVNCAVGCAGGASTPADNFANPTTAGLQTGFNMVYDGANWDMLRGTSADGVLVNLGANNDVTVTGSVTVTDGAGALNVICDSGCSGGTQYAEDDASAGSELMTLAGAIRQATPTVTVSADGDYSNLKVDSVGRLWVNNSGVTQSDNITQFGGNNVVTGTGASGSGIPRVTVANDSNVLATQSGTWNINNVSGTVSLPAGASTLAEQQTQTTALQLIDNLPLAQGSTTSGQSGVLTQGAVTAAAPTYTNGQTSPLSLTTSGELRVAGTFSAGIVQVEDSMGAAQNVGYDTGDLNLPTQNISDGATASAVPAWATMVGGTDGTNLRALSVTSGGALNINNVAGTVNLPTGASTLAEQQTQTTSLQLLDDTVFTDDTSTHSTGTTKVLGIGAVATPTDTALNANDIGMPGMTNNRELYSVIRDAAGNARGANVDANNRLSVSVDAFTATNASVNVAQINGVATTMGNGASGTGVQRVTLASDSTGNIATIGTSVTPGTAAANLGKAEDNVHSTGDVGVMAFSVRDDYPPAATSGTTGDYQPLTTDATGRLYVTFNDPCVFGSKVYTPISQTAGAQLVAGTASQRLYVCSIVMISATAQNIALVSGTGTVCATSTGPLMGGTTAATGFNLAANGGLTFGNGLGALAQTDTDADNVCLLQSGSGQISGVITTVSR